MLIDIDEVDAGYGENQVLHQLDLSIEADRVNCIIGPNGSGKSTTLKTVCGLVDVWNGTIEIKGQDLSNAHPRDVIEAGVVMLPQGGNVFPDLTVNENLRLGAYLTDDEDELERRFQSAYETFPVLRDRKGSDASQLSGGQQMMVAFGRALMADPDIFLLDEPSAGLAPQLVDDVFEQVERLKENNRDMVIIEQNIRRVLDVADYAYVLDQGQCVFNGPTEELHDESEIIEMYIGDRHA